MTKLTRNRYALMGIGILLTAAIITGCGAYAVAPVTGYLYSDVKAGMGATSNTGGMKMGTAECSSILGLFGMGDASIATAMKNGGITKISHVDYHSTNILGLYAKYVIMVYGE